MALSNDQLRAFDDLRQRLSQLSIFIETRKANLRNSDPLPSWPDLQGDHDHIVRNLSEVQETLSKHRELFTSAHAYPLPTFPGRTKEGTLSAVLRKKLETRGEDWIAEHLKFGTETSGQANGSVDGTTTAHPLNTSEAKQLWGEASQSHRDMLGDFLQGGVFDDDYTIAEREAGIESVVTGLRRKLNDEDESDEEDDDEGGDEDEKMEDVLPAKPASTVEPSKGNTVQPLRLETLLRFMTTGQLPPDR
ncbi:hypothetical protein BAUCODRAFT_550026 [Baudoinia panamericana UAMH 10762]|uniref:Mediator of RNA polymerase II transcription subunit 8 n=1 Tax=Baudoinia panamericana (strain UAMH 10762) TaxID=717646 RepID=M2N6W0_BAUPA|nr:uncharacterized protein BAUCODRAFT_550026 [Baudoinia panamericana UAMH 10762]EMC94500.1 hypothetical protein BAUCODRAFT_550026 [Baudoinia panamericana UAMH 10762]